MLTLDQRVERIMDHICELLRENDSVIFAETYILQELEAAIADSRAWTYVEDQVPATPDPVLLAHASNKYPTGEFMSVSYYDEDEQTWHDELTQDPLVPIAYQALPPYPRRREKPNA